MRSRVLRLAGLAVMVGAVVLALSVSPVRRASAAAVAECRSGDGISQVAACREVANPPVVDDRMALKAAVLVLGVGAGLALMAFSFPAELVPQKMFASSRDNP